MKGNFLFSNLAADPCFTEESSENRELRHNFLPWCRRRPCNQRGRGAWCSSSCRCSRTAGSSPEDGKSNHSHINNILYNVNLAKVENLAWWKNTDDALLVLLPVDLHRGDNRKRRWCSGRVRCRRGRGARGWCTRRPSCSCDSGERMCSGALSVSKITMNFLN